jgi:hypothetical protein
LAWESRPLRDDPPAFLCAMVPLLLRPSPDRDQAIESMRNSVKF